MKYLLCLAMTVLALAGCRKPADHADKHAEERAPRSAEVESDIRFALAKFIFKNNASGAQQGVDYFFLKIDGGDPSKGFIARFAGQKPTVLPASLADGNAGKGVIHKETKGSGLIFSIHKIDWISDTEVKVFWGYYEASLSASGNEATLKLGEKGWTVTADVLKVIS